MNYYEIVLYELRHRQRFCVRQAVLVADAARRSHAEASEFLALWLQRGRATDAESAVTAQRRTATLHADYRRWIGEADGLGDVLSQVRPA